MKYAQVQAEACNAAAHCCLLDPTRPYQKLPLHLLEPSLIFLSLYYNNMRVYIAHWYFTNIP